jgi:hypothetical protein
MSKFRFLVVVAGAVLAMGAAGALANVGAATRSNSDSHGDSVASAARTGCPHGPDGVHGQCVSAIAKTNAEAKTDDACKTADVNEDSTEKTAESKEDASEKAAHTSKAADKTEDGSEKSNEHSEDKTEKKQVKDCEAAQASNK